MSQTIDVNGQSINYPETGDTNWGDEATDFAVQTSAAFGKIGLASGTSVDIQQTLDVTGNTTLDANLSVAGIVNVDSGVLYVDPATNKVGINDTTPSEALDVTGNVAISGNETVGGTLNVAGATSLSSTLAVTGNSTLAGNLSVNGNTTLGDATGDSLTINGNAISIPNGLNIDSNTLVINAASNRVGIGVASPVVPLDIQSDSSAIGLVIRGRSSDNSAQIRFFNNADTLRFISGVSVSDSYIIASSTGVGVFNITQTGQLSAVVPGGSTLYPGYLCRAWVNFNGTLAAASMIRASGNVSSITDNGTGDYTVNFTTAMPDVNFARFHSGRLEGVAIIINEVNPSVPAATVNGLRIVTLNSSFSSVDASQISVGVFR